MSRAGLLSEQTVSMRDPRRNNPNKVSKEFYQMNFEQVLHANLEWAK